jgi:cytoskeletal protein CcmA (bactofilin family)
MFTKTEPMTSSSAPSVPNAARPGGNSKSILASDLRIVGEISSTGQIEVLGEVEGNLVAKGLLIGTEGRVSGTVHSDIVEVKGVLNGSVKSQSFALRSTAEVQADITYSTLTIESGAQIEGKFALNK